MFRKKEVALTGKSLPLEQILTRTLILSLCNFPLHLWISQNLLDNIFKFRNFFRLLTIWLQSFFSIALLPISKPEFSTLEGWSAHCPALRFALHFLWSFLHLKQFCHSFLNASHASMSGSKPCLRNKILKFFYLCWYVTFATTKVTCGWVTFHIFPVCRLLQCL